MIKKAVAILIPAGLLWLLIDQYVRTPAIAFDPPAPFSGERFYNPYEGFDAAGWTLANFHAHTRSWYGLTNGEGTPADIYAAYDSLGYGIHAVSEYQKISRYGEESPSYISAYEHGYGAPKSHQLVLGDNRVNWKEYMFPLTLSNKQHILDRLAENPDNVIVLNHPQMRNGYRPGDLKFLYNYDCVEVLNPASLGFVHWDSALSAGKSVFIIGNDDIHHVFNRKDPGRYATLLHAPNRRREEVLRALKEGRTMGVAIPQQPVMSFQEKIEKLRKSGPALRKLTVDSSLLRVLFSAPVYDLTITGQGGRIVWQVSQTDSVGYTILPQDTYLRVSYTTSDSLTYYLNPVFRYQGRIGNRKKTASP